ncbi:hypothetical protein, partial [Paenibacillus sp. tmac-D7]|uniref:hypothetical protein n=1 Tax=Paenibacillus sp. tmac-D7 TaxID=2591462 RepID=UPI001C63DB11
LTKPRRYAISSLSFIVASFSGDFYNIPHVPSRLQALFIFQFQPDFIMLASDSTTSNKISYPSGSCQA